MAILIHPHARERMDERETTEDEVRVTISQGEKFPVERLNVHVGLGSPLLDVVS